jgi:hypothetical protein
VFFALGQDIRRGPGVEGVVMNVSATILHEMGYLE